MHKSHIPMITQVVSTGFHIVWCHILVVYCGMGIRGTSIATCLTYATNFIVVVVYTTLVDKRLRRIWTFDSSAFKGWKSYLELGIPGTLMIVLDWWVVEILNLESGYLVIEATAAEMVLNNLHTLCFQIPLGI
jgi:MATE family multidrug resistance protein